MKIICKLLFLCELILASDAYRILAIFPFNSRSHNNFFEGATKGLAKRGHQVDVISHFELKNPPKNYRTIINLSGTRKHVVNNVAMDFVSKLENDHTRTIAVTFGNELCELLAHEEIQKLLKNPPRDPPYDLLIVKGVTRGLAKRGHQVDVITHYEMKNPPKNYRTIINLSGTRRSVVNNFTMEFVTQLQGDISRIVAVTFGNELCELLALEEIQKLVKNPPKDPSYDIVIVEAFNANCFFGIGHVLNVPVISVSSLPEFTWTNGVVGNPDSTAFAANFMMDSAKVSNFWERLENVIISHHKKFKFFRFTEEVQTNQMRKYLSPDMPNIREVEKSVALALINSHYTLFGIKTRVPALIDIAGIHVEDPDITVSPSLQKWLDESSHGVVYFTLGSMVLIETLPKETLLAIYASFEKIAPVRVLMKIKNKEQLPPGLPKNVLTSDWIPQLQVLSHNNTRLFISHGGLISTEEALYYGVPIIGLPLWGDQLFNIGIFVKKNMAIRLNHKTLTEKDFDESLDAILNNPKYREAAKYESRLFRDRPITATETVNFWVEYVIRNGPDALRSPSVNMHWWQIALLDVYGFLFLISAIIIYLFIFILKHVICAFLKCLMPKAQIHKKRE